MCLLGVGKTQYITGNIKNVSHTDLIRAITHKKGF
jgi:hypothetical protein